MLRDDVARRSPRRRRAPVDEQLGDAAARATSPSESIARHGAALVDRARSTTALAFADRFAPEHLELLVRDADARRGDACTHAGAIFVGAFTPEAAGDYLAGPEPRAADGRHGALRLAARRLRLRQAHVDLRCTTRRCAAHARRHRRARRGRGLARARARRIEETQMSDDERAGRSSSAQPLRGAPAYHVPAHPQRHQARRQRVAVSALARGDGGDRRARSARSRSTAIPTPRRRELRALVGAAARRRRRAADVRQRLRRADRAAVRDVRRAARRANASRRSRTRCRGSSSSARRRWRTGWSRSRCRSAPRFEADEAALFAAVAEHKPNLIFLATPNNPTGTLWPRATVEQAAARTSGRHHRRRRGVPRLLRRQELRRSGARARQLRGVADAVEDRAGRRCASAMLIGRRELLASRREGAPAVQPDDAVAARGAQLLRRSQERSSSRTSRR